jgi:hypothetical protein
MPQQSQAASRQWHVNGRRRRLDPTDDANAPDSLSLGAYADALVLLMDWKETSTPLTIAINGPWGSDKTSLTKMAEAYPPIGSDWDESHVICWFDAWASRATRHLSNGITPPPMRGMGPRPSATASVGPGLNANSVGSPASQAADSAVRGCRVVS